MPITRGARKAHEASLRKRVFNIRRKSVLADATKGVKKLVAAGDAAAARAALPAAQKAIDKALKRGIIKPNTASRKIARLAAAAKRTAAK